MTAENENQQEEVQKDEKMPEEAVLFPEADVRGIIVKPWTFGKLFKVSNLLESVIQRLEDKKLDQIFTKDHASYTEIATLFTTALSSEILDIIAITLEKEKVEVEEFDLETGVEIALVIFQQNQKTIKNAFAPLFQAMQMTPADQ